MGQKKKHLIFGILTEFQVFLVHIFVKIGGGCGIRTHVGVNPNGFQDEFSSSHTVPNSHKTHLIIAKNHPFLNTF